jgi:hypothetical protein
MTKTKSRKKYQLISFIDILWVSLNPTQQAISEKAIFGNSNGLWNIYRKAGLIHETTCSIAPNNMQETIYVRKIGTDYNMEHLDLLPHIIETDSNLVNPTIKDVYVFIEKIKCNPPKVIALMGQKVVDAFHKAYPELKSWKKMKGKFGQIGELNIDGVLVPVFKLPFPVNNSIPNKHEHYKLVKNAVDSLLSLKKAS